MKDLNFGKFNITKDSKALIIAEAADSHNGSVETAKKLIEAAHSAGADVIKFQLHLPDEEMVPGSIQMWDGPLYDILKRHLITPEDHRQLKHHCEKVGIQYLCTPFCPKAVEILNDYVGVDAFKTGSGEFLNYPMLKKMTEYAKNGNRAMIVSTGMSHYEEVVETANFLKGLDAPFMFTHCTSEYPSKHKDVNLGLIPKYREELGIHIGLSCHTLDLYTAFASVPLGAKVIEKHFTLDRTQKGPDHFISLEPVELAEMVRGVRRIEAAMKSERKVWDEEAPVRAWAHHSIVANRDLKEGEILTEENLIVKRPGNGVPAKHLWSFLGKRVKRDVVKNDFVKWEDLTQ